MHNCKITPLGHPHFTPSSAGKPTSTLQRGLLPCPSLSRQDSGIFSPMSLSSCSKASERHSAEHGVFLAESPLWQVHGTASALQAGRGNSQDFTCSLSKLQSPIGPAGSPAAVPTPPSGAFHCFPISVLSSCWNKIPWTGTLRNNTHLLLTVLQAGSPRSRGRTATFWGQPSSWSIASTFLLCPHVVKGSREGTGPIHEGSSLMTQDPPPPGPTF